MKYHHTTIKDEKTLNEAAKEMSGNEYTIYHDKGNGSIYLVPEYANDRPISMRWQSVSLEWVKGYLWSQKPKPSKFQLIYNKELSGLGSFDMNLYDLFLLADNGNRKALIKGFPDFFNPGDEKLEW